MIVNIVKCVFGHVEHEVLFYKYFRHIVRYMDLEITNKVWIRRYILIVIGHPCLIPVSCAFSSLPEEQTWDLERAHHVHCIEQSQDTKLDLYLFNEISSIGITSLQWKR